MAVARADRGDAGAGCICDGTSSTAAGLGLMRGRHLQVPAHLALAEALDLDVVAGFYASVGNLF